jgi:hypothetical protein
MKARNGRDRCLSDIAFRDWALFLGQWRRRIPAIRDPRSRVRSKLGLISTPNIPHRVEGGRGRAPARYRPPCL